MIATEFAAVGFARPSAAALAAAVPWRLAALVVAIGVLWQAPSRSQEGDAVTLSIVGTSDLHGAIAGDGLRGGLALFGGYVANLRAARAVDGGAVLLIDSGDLFQGTLESNLNEGAAVVAAYNALGYTAAAIGNHDFDFGPVGERATPQRPGDDPRGALKARAAEAGFAFLAANVVDTTTNEPVASLNIHPSVTVEAAGLSVGVIGVTTERTLFGTIAANTAGLRIAPLAETIEAEARRLRSAGAAVVLVAAHAGDARCLDVSAPTDLSSCNTSAEIVRVANELPAGLVDVIVAGHSHGAMAHEVNGVAIIESYANGRAFGRVDLVIDRATKRVLRQSIFPPRDICARVLAGTSACDAAVPAAELVVAEYEGAPVVEEAAIAATIGPAIDAARVHRAEPLGVTLPQPLRRQGEVESPLGNLVTDAYLAVVPDADVAIHNTAGGLRADLPAGPLTYGSVFEVMPFDNRVVGVQMTGAELRSTLAAVVRTRFARPGLAGLRARVSCADGDLTVTLLRPDGAAVGDEEVLIVATNDFVALGGDRIFESIMPAGGFSFSRDAGTVRDAIVAALRSRSDSLREYDLVDAENPRWVLPSPQPVTCQP